MMMMKMKNPDSGASRMTRILTCHYVTPLLLESLGEVLKILRLQRHTVLHRAADGRPISLPCCHQIHPVAVDASKPSQLPTQSCREALRSAIHAWRWQA